MNRRNFIKVIGLGIGTAALSSTLSGCTEQPLELGWQSPVSNEQDIRMQVLAFAILSPNPHNKQPWIIRMTGPNSFDLYVDPERLLPETDPYHRQIHIGQGTFLETLAIAATGLGHRAQIDYFPQGIYGNSELVWKPVASITLISEPAITTDPLFHQLLVRHSNKRPYDNQPLTTAEIQQLEFSHKKHSQQPLMISSTASTKQALQPILTKAMQIEVGDKKRDHETIEMFRFNREEVERYRDGFGVAQAGITGLKKVIAEKFFLSREAVEKDPTEFGQQAVTATKDAAESTATFGWLTTPTNTRLDQVLAGRAYNRLNLQTTAMGLAQHPMSQVLQEYPDMLPLQAEFKNALNIDPQHTVQMLFRLGRAEPTPHSPRRLVSDLVIA